MNNEGRMMRSSILGAGLCATLAAPAFAAAPAVVSDAWFRALPSDLPAGGYFTLRNTGSATLTLIGAASPACGMLMLHKSDESGGMSRMQDVSALEVPPAGAVQFAPGGYHLMCMNPTAAMKPGATVTVTFSFKGGSTLMADFAVRDAAGK